MLVTVAGAAVIARVVWGRTQAGIIADLEQHFSARITIEAVDLSVFPTLRMTGRGLRLQRQTDSSDRPLISVGAFTATASPLGLWRGRLTRLTLAGLEIYIAPDAASAGRPEPAPRGDRGRAMDAMRGWVIGEVVSTGARLEIAPDDPTGTPLEFEIFDVQLRDFSLEAPAAFEARLINPRPRGEIRTAGSFGPWNGPEPRLTPLAGDYTLAGADMSVFGGLGGTLDSTGQFKGVLESIAVSGRATMADFQVDTGRHPMPLDTTFDARVDGTNGNTYLDRVSATLAASLLEAHGEIAGTAGGDGKTIRLDTSATGARLEDFIRLVVSQDAPPMAGAIAFDARLELPPGDQPVVDRLRLDGQFKIRGGRFTSDAVQGKVDELSRRGQGEPGNDDIENVLSNFSGRFRLRDGRLALPDLRFAVRGATVELAGSYGLRGEVLDFEGHLRLDARLSQTTTGFKSVLLKVIDPFFSKHGAGAVLPIRIGGTVTEPEFGLRMFGR